MSPIDIHHTLHAPILGTPLHEVRTCPDGVGRYRTYERGSIHHHPDTGTWETHGGIRDCWKMLGGESGFLGYPVSDEVDFIGNLLLHETVSDAFFLRHPRGAFSRLMNPIYEWMHTPPQFPVGHVHGRCSLFRGGAIIWWNDPEVMRKADFTALLRPSNALPSNGYWMPIRGVRKESILDKLGARLDPKFASGQVCVRKIPANYHLSIPVADLKLPRTAQWPESLHY
jgi:LGFP repeat